MKICLDAGHGTGQNQSPARCGYFEGDRMFTLQRLLQQELEAYGVTVVCTRAARQDDPPLYTRALAAKDCDLFLSLHSNAAGNGVCESVDYPVVFYPVSGKGIGLAAELAECIHKTMGTLQPAQTRIRWNSAHNADYYGVIRFTAAFGVTGMILEHSFHTNTRMTSWLLDDENLKRLAAAEAAAIAEHYGLKKTADEPQRAETVCYHLLSDVPQGDYRTVLDKLIAIAEYKKIEPLLIVTKTDLGEWESLASLYKKAGFQVFCTGLDSDSDLEPLRRAMEGKISAFCGNSGVGKSSLLNRLDSRLDLSTAQISQKLGRGRHTTRHVQLYPVSNGGYIADTPGFSSLDLERYEVILKDQLQYCFREFEPYWNQCRFTGCSHTKESGCALLAALEKGEISPSRHASYCTLYEAAKNIREWELQKK